METCPTVWPMNLGKKQNYYLLFVNNKLNTVKISLVLHLNCYYFYAKNILK